MMCRPLCVDHVAPAAERFGADSEIADAKKLFTPGGASQTLIPVRMTGGRGKIRCGFGNYGREEAFYTRRRLPNLRSSSDDRRPRKDSARIRKLRTRRSLLHPEITDAKKLYIPGGFGRKWKITPANKAKYLHSTRLVLKSSDSEIWPFHIDCGNIRPGLENIPANQ